MVRLSLESYKLCVHNRSLKTTTHHLYSMTVAQKKIALISWIANLEDENLINQLDGFRKVSLAELPKEVVEFLHISEAEGIDSCVVHTSSRNILSNSK